MSAAVASMGRRIRGRFLRVAGKRARALDRAHRAASVAAVAFVAADMRCSECNAAAAAATAAIAAQVRRLTSARVQRLLVGGLLGDSGPLGVAAQHLRVSLGLTAMPRLRLLDLETKVVLLEKDMDADLARRQLRHAERRRAAALRSMQRCIDKLRRLRRRRDAGPPVERVDLVALMRPPADELAAV